MVTSCIDGVGTTHGTAPKPHPGHLGPVERRVRIARLGESPELEGGDAVALSDGLEQLAARARAIEENAREAEAKGRAGLEAKAAEARKSADEHAAQLRAKGQKTSDDAERSWNEVRRTWKEHVATIRTRIDERKAELDADRAELHADWAESDALDAIDFAASALDEAEYAVLDAELARIKADELAAS